MQLTLTKYFLMSIHDCGYIMIVLDMPWKTKLDSTIWRWYMFLVDIMILDFLWQHSSLVRATSGSGWSATTQLLNLKVKRVLILDVWHSLNAWCQRSMWSVQDLFLLSFMKFHPPYCTRQWSEDVSTRFTLLQRTDQSHVSHTYNLKGNYVLISDPGF